MGSGRWSDLRLADPILLRQTPNEDRSAATADVKEIPADGVIFAAMAAQVAVGVTTRIGQTWVGMGVSRKRAILAENVIGILYADYVTEGHDRGENLIFPVKAHTFVFLSALNDVANVVVQGTLSWMRFD